GTRVQAVITTKDPVADERTKIRWDSAFKFDGQIRDAPARVHPMRTGDRTRWARCNTTVARSTTTRDRLVGGQYQSRQDFCEKKPRPEAPIDEHGTFAVPPDAGFCGVIPFQNRAGINVTFLFTSELAKEIVDLVEFLSDHIVIILTPRIPRDPTCSGGL